MSISAHSRIVGLGVAAWLAFGARVPAQNVVMRPVPVPAVAVEDLVRTVADLDRSVAFYRDVVGLPERPSAVAVTDTTVRRLTNTPGARVRSARFGIPGTVAGLLLTEFSGVDRRPQRPRNSDPGASTLVVMVRDLDRVLAAARAGGAPIVTAGGEALTLTTGTRSVFVTDPDGFFVEIVETDPLPATAAVEAGNVVLGRVAFTVADAEPVVVFYRDVLGFAVRRGGDFSANAAVGRLVGVEGGEFRTTFAQIPRSALEWEFVEFRGVERIHYAGRVQDPGVAAMSVRVGDVRAAARAMRAAGLTIISTGGEPAMTDTGGAVLVRDPGGLLLQLTERR